MKVTAETLVQANSNGLQSVLWIYRTLSGQTIHTSVNRPAKRIELQRAIRKLA